MCGRYTLTRTGRLKLTNRFDLSEEFDDEKFAPLYNLAPTEEAPVIIEENDRRIAVPMLFGLIPHWAKDAKIASQCINARAETVADKPAFRASFRKKRCLVIADGYYEWKHEGKIKIPHRVTLKSEDWFAFAALWDTWTGPSGKEVRSFSIITTETNGLTREFHDRMPVILKHEDEAMWISHVVTEPKTLLPLLRPYPVDEMKLQRVSTRVNSAYNKDPSVLDPDPPVNS